MGRGGDRNSLHEMVSSFQDASVSRGAAEVVLTEAVEKGTIDCEWLKGVTRELIKRSPYDRGTELLFQWLKHIDPDSDISMGSVRAESAWELQRNIREMVVGATDDILKLVLKASNRDTSPVLTLLARNPSGITHDQLAAFANRSIGIGGDDVHLVLLALTRPDLRVEALALAPRLHDGIDEILRMGWKPWEGDPHKAEVWLSDVLQEAEKRAATTYPHSVQRKNLEKLRGRLAKKTDHLKKGREKREREQEERNTMTNLIAWSIAGSSAYEQWLYAYKNRQEGTPLPKIPSALTSIVSVLIQEYVGGDARLIADAVPCMQEEIKALHGREFLSAVLASATEAEQRDGRPMRRFFRWASLGFVCPYQIEHDVRPEIREALGKLDRNESSALRIGDVPHRGGARHGPRKVSEYIS